jgi:uncharacterized protein YndB with AHSA1/START domain
VSDRGRNTLGKMTARIVGSLPRAHDAAAARVSVVTASLIAPARGSPLPVATNRRFMPVPPQTVWEALADPAGYAHWVVGSKEVRDADAGFPAPGTRFHHTIGFGPLKVDDHTESLEAEPPSYLRLRAKARPLGTATVIFEVMPVDGGTTVRITENPDGLTSILRLNPLVHLFTKARNAESLMRLEELALRRAG